jgi:hypothetical protein
MVVEAVAPTFPSSFVFIFLIWRHCRDVERKRVISRRGIRLQHTPAIGEAALAMARACHLLSNFAAEGVQRCSSRNRLPRRQVCAEGPPRVHRRLGRTYQRRGSAPPPSAAVLYCLNYHGLRRGQYKYVRLWLDPTTRRVRAKAFMRRMIRRSVNAIETACCDEPSPSS